jgi:Uncharacterized protein conserved in bacteria (DUF2314)
VRQKREALRIGDRVKLLFAGQTGAGGEVVERMWVEVTSVSTANYEGRLLNEPSEITSVQHGDLVRFAPKHVAGFLYTPEELGYDPSELAWVRTESSVPKGERPAQVSMRPTDLRATGGDSGWILGRGDESPGELTDSEVFRWMDLGWLTDLFPELEPVFRTSEGVWRWDVGARTYMRTE